MSSSVPIAGLVSIINKPADTTALIAGLIRNAETLSSPTSLAVTATPPIITATLSGSNIATALGLTGHGNAPVIDLCCKLSEAGHDPHLPLYVYRGDVLALRIRSIGEGAALEVSQHGTGFVGRHRRRAAPPSSPSTLGKGSAASTQTRPGGPARQQTGVAISPASVRSPEPKPLCIEQLTTADLPSGEPQAPADDYDVIYQMVHRADGETLWRKISLSPAVSARDAGESLSKERRQ